MPRIYSVNESHNCDFGVDFFNGVAAVSQLDTQSIAWFTAKGYKVLDGQDFLSFWDTLTVEQVTTIANAAGVTTEDKKKWEIVTGLETALKSVINMDINSFEALADINGGKVGAAAYTDAAAIIQDLPSKVMAELETSGLKVEIPIDTWVDTDTYDKTAAGSYTFTATLDTLPDPITNTGTKTISVEVVVAAE